MHDKLIRNTGLAVRIPRRVELSDHKAWLVGYSLLVEATNKEQGCNIVQSVFRALITDSNRDSFGFVPVFPLIPPQTKKTN